MNRKSFVRAATVVLLSGVAVCAAWDPAAAPEATVISGDVRITVLTPRLVRLEWCENAAFEDHASLTFVNRRTETPQFDATEQDGYLIVKTDSLTVRYKIGSGRFTSDNLSVEVDTGGIQTTWRYGDVDANNLLGTTRTLDRCNADWQAVKKERIELEQGIVSRSGWAVVDDTHRPLFDQSDWPWVTERPAGDHQDLYFFGYGYDYKAAMKDFTTVAGKIALPPRFVFGNWWSRYWNYDDQQLRDLVNEFDRYDLGLDVLVVDMDWHIVSRPEWYDDTGNKLRDAADQRYGWTGFTWNTNFFPEPERFLQWTNESNLKTCLNLHPASGIQPHEEVYPEFARAMGIDPDTQDYVPFDIVSEEFARLYMELLLHPMEKMGVDFWWLDWQQWSTTRIEGVNPTFYLNYVHFSDMERRGKRPLIFHRWGGLGNHRYQIGFSGDTLITWESLAYQPYFTATASNVGFGYWSHDIGGHYVRYGFGIPHSPELYTRWIQWGVLSPVFRTHCTADPRLERRPWAYPMAYFQAMRDAYDLRYALVPYIYTSARQAYDTGISLCRPLYYEWPRQEESYTHRNQYLFGDSLLVNPVVAPMEEGKLYAPQKTWLPEGQWIEWDTGEVFDGPITIERPFTLDQIPVYVKAGAIVPTAPKMKNTEERPVDPLILNIFPGDGGTLSLYEDAGNDLTFQDGRFAFTDIAFTRSDDTTEITIHPVRGMYAEMPTFRGYQIRLVNTLPPKAVTVNGKPVAYNEKPVADSWNYDGAEVTTLIHIDRQYVSRQVKIVVENDPTDAVATDGVKGKLKRLRDFVDYVGRAPQPMYRFEPVVHAALAGIRMTYDPSAAADEIAAFGDRYRRSMEIVESMLDECPDWKPYLELMQKDTSGN